MPTFIVAPRPPSPTGRGAVVALVAVAALPLLGEGPGGASRQAWARWAAVVAFSLLGATALAGLADWIALFLRTRAGPTGFEPAPVDLITPLVFLAVCVGVVVLLLTPTTRGTSSLAGSSEPQH